MERERGTLANRSIPSGGHFYSKRSAPSATIMGGFLRHHGRRDRRGWGSFQPRRYCLTCPSMVLLAPGLGG
eukprot:614317-Rhodomonas_salina.1